MPKDELELEEANEEETRGPPSVFTCPDCNGSLWELSDGKALRYRCHVGHAFGPASLFAGQSEALDRASLLRGVLERGELVSDDERSDERGVAADREH